MKSWDFFSKTNKTDLRTTFYDTVDLIPEEHWNPLVGEKNIYLSLPYLKALEDSLKSQVSFHYVLFYNNQLHSVAIAYVQVLNFVDSGNKYSDELCVLGDKIRHKILGNIDIKVMICGNAFTCGENGFMFSNALSPREAYSNLSNALYKLRRSESLDGQVSMVLMKEFWPEHFNQVEILKKNGYRDFMIDVNMVMEIHPSWKNMDNYLDSMVSKFRTKARQVYRKSEAIEVRSMDAGQIDVYADAIVVLYKNVLSKAEFKFGELKSETFSYLKQQLRDKYIFKGYFLEDELIGFSTAYHYDGVLDANYVGINYDYNQSKALYQRMLYDHVAEAIALKVSSLRLGRTAELIKSSLGAHPVDMKLFIKHKNVVSNQIIKPIIDSISPSEYELRRPFKASFE